jgi:hypothetical protein
MRQAGEIADLAIEIFISTYGMTMEEAYDQARQTIGELLEYAAVWDFQASALMHQATQPVAA